MEKKETIFTKKPYVILFALIAMCAWGFAYPFIKLGMIEWGIGSDDVGGKMLFAGIRFSTAGILTLGIAKLKKETVLIKNVNHLAWLFTFGLFNTALHYFCFYNGLSNCEGGKASVINALSPFLVILLATIIYKEKMTGRKILGCILGFVGIIVVNYGTNMSGFALNGEGMIILNCIFSAIGSILTRVVTRKVTAISATGYSLALGGFMLVITGFLAGGNLQQVTAKGIWILLALITISMVGFILNNQLLCYNPIGEIAIFHALIPAFGILTSCLLLGEAFNMNNFLGLVCTSLGIVVIHYRRKE